MLVVDSGYFLDDQRNSHGGSLADMAVNNEWMLKAYRQFEMDAVNLSASDLRFLSKFLARSSAQTAEKQYIIERFVSANIQSQLLDIITPQPFLIREISGGKNEPSGLKVAFVGLTRKEPAPPAGLTITDPLEAARRAVPEAKQRADIVVLLAHMSTAEALLLARQVPGIDVIITGNGEIFTPPIETGQTLIVFTPFETRKVGELRFYRDAEGKFSVKDRYIVLDAATPEDAEAARLITAAVEAEKIERTRSRKFLEEWSALTRSFKKPEGGGSGATSAPVYVSSNACYECHTSQYLKWANTAHIRASDPIILKPAEFERSCFDCHTSGPKKETILVAGDGPLLQNVQCEACHGPASNHVTNPVKGYGRIPDMMASCLRCHTPSVSPNFDLQTYWDKIKH